MISKRLLFVPVLLALSSCLRAPSGVLVCPSFGVQSEKWSSAGWNYRTEVQGQFGEEYTVTLPASACARVEAKK